MDGRDLGALAPNSFSLVLVDATEPQMCPFKSFVGPVRGKATSARLGTPGSLGIMLACTVSHTRIRAAKFETPLGLIVFVLRERHLASRWLVRRIRG